MQEWQNIEPIFVVLDQSKYCLSKMFAKKAANLQLQGMSQIRKANQTIYLTQCKTALCEVWESNKNGPLNMSQKDMRDLGPVLPESLVGHDEVWQAKT